MGGAAKTECFATIPFGLGQFSAKEGSFRSEGVDPGQLKIFVIF